MPGARTARVYLGLGSNLGDREANLVGALEKMEGPVTLERISSLYETEPQGFEAQPWFYNAVARVGTALAPLQLLAWVKGLEQDLGRLPSFPQGPRLIDIDILVWGCLEMASPELAIPHVRLHERAFVLAPLAELAPGLQVRGKRVREWLGQARGEVRRREWSRLPEYLARFKKKGFNDAPP